MRTDSLLHPGRCPLRADGSAPGSAPAAPPRRLRPGGGLRVFTPSIDPAPPSCRRLPSPGPSASPFARPAAHRDRPAAGACHLPRPSPSRQPAPATCPVPRPPGSRRLPPAPSLALPAAGACHLPRPSPVRHPAPRPPAPPFARQAPRASTTCLTPHPSCPPPSPARQPVPQPPLCAPPRPAAPLLDPRHKPPLVDGAPQLPCRVASFVPHASHVPLAQPDFGGPCRRAPPAPAVRTSELTDLTRDFMVLGPTVDGPARTRLLCPLTRNSCPNH
ncbi:hypothetical protein QF032_001667 [Streptomyces achromogenes]|nr:hypothetical protein [Streptomyces achromogenes]